jgi:hypothetical protein
MNIEEKEIEGAFFYLQLKRTERNELLQETDKYVLIDYPITNENLIIIKEYRQSLRDFSSNNYILPKKPDLKTL